MVDRVVKQARHTHIMTSHDDEDTSVVYIDTFGGENIAADVDGQQETAVREIRKREDSPASGVGGKI